MSNTKFNNAAVNKVVANFDGLKKLIRSFKEGNNLRAKVGILANKNNRTDGSSNASIGAKHEFGSYSENIPQRSFLDMPLKEKSKEIYKVALKTIPQDIKDGDLTPTLTRIGMAGEGIVEDAFKSGGFGKWQPISPLTEAIKGTNAILINTGELRRSIASSVVKVSG